MDAKGRSKRVKVGHRVLGNARSAVLEHTTIQSCWNYCIVRLLTRKDSAKSLMVYPNEMPRR